MIVERIEEHLTITAMPVGTPFLDDEIAMGIEEVGIRLLTNPLEVNADLPLVVDDKVLTHLCTVVHGYLDIHTREAVLVVIGHILLRLGISLADSLQLTLLVLPLH